MAYGKNCPVCGSTVDSNEFDYTRNMCKDCSFEQDLEDMRRSKVARLMNSECEQMTLEV